VDDGRRRGTVDESRAVVPPAGRQAAEVFDPDEEPAEAGAEEAPPDDEEPDEEPEEPDDAAAAGALLDPLLDPLSEELELDDDDELSDAAAVEAEDFARESVR
jgi:hypothetical protein